jgi:hypothetical protein
MFEDSSVTVYIISTAMTGWMLFREITAALLCYHNKTHKTPMQENESSFLCVTAGCKVTTMLINVTY